MQHPCVLEAAVIGLPDANGLTRVVAYAVLKPLQAPSEALCEEIKLFVKNKIAPYKYPRTLHIIKELPKTATGKIQRFKLRDLQEH